MQHKHSGAKDVHFLARPSVPDDPDAGGGLWKQGAKRLEPAGPGRLVDWSTLLVVALVVAAVAGVLLLPRRKQWNADGAADKTRAETELDAEDQRPKSEEDA